MRLVQILASHRSLGLLFSCQLLGFRVLTYNRSTVLSFPFVVVNAMGQYYIIVNADTKDFVSPRACPSESCMFMMSSKLMAHAYIGSSVVRTVESLLIEGGK